MRMRGMLFCGLWFRRFCSVISQLHLFWGSDKITCHGREHVTEQSCPSSHKGWKAERRQVALE